MAKTRYNHRKNIEGYQPARFKSIYPGMIVECSYTAPKAFDNKPLILVLWNDYENYKIHGINLNYLTEYKIKRMFSEIMRGPTAKLDDNIPLIEEDQIEVDIKLGKPTPGQYDDNLPYRNLLKKPFTRLKLPTFRETKGGAGNPVSKSEAEHGMKLIYNRVLKRFVKKEDMYRSYSYDKMETMKAVKYKIVGLLD